MTKLTIALTDEYGREWQATYERAAKGQFAKRVRLERKQDNGKYVFWTMYRPACHGELSNALKAELERTDRMARTA